MLGSTRIVQPRLAAFLPRQSRGISSTPVARLAAVVDAPQGEEASGKKKIMKDFKIYRWVSACDTGHVRRH
jgi:hypothetical protein